MDNIQTLRNILEALMTISVRGNDTITMGNCMQALQQVIEYMTSASAQSSISAPIEKKEEVSE